MDRKVFLDTYEVLEILGSGSGGIVYKAYHKRLKKEVVLKKLIRKNINMQMNRQEVDILKNLNNTYLPQVFDFLEIDGSIYTVMSFVPGKSFQELLKEGARFTKGELIRWGMQLCSALNYLHSQRPPIIHSDIKPSNIMLTPEGNICLIDFNISFFLDSSTVLGYTDGYTSPEQYIIALDRKSQSSVPNYKRIDEKSDIYSAGATFYHLATGRKAGKYRNAEEAELLSGIMGEAFSNVIRKAMEIDPQKRFADAFEMFQAFQGIYKKDKRYQWLLRRQFAIRSGLVCILAASIVSCGYGIHTIRLEKVEAYNELVEKQTDYRAAGEYEQEEKMHKKAVDVLPSGLETYYQKACAFYEQQKYKECIEFIDYDILKNEKLDLLNLRMADVYYLKAESCFELKEYEKAVQAFELVFSYGGFKSEYYRDYAITLAYNGKPEKAQKVLQNAIDHELGEDSIYYAKGEIEKSESKYDEAVREFKQCIAVTENDDLKMRAYVMLGRIYEEQEELLKERAILLEAKKSLPKEKQMIILEQLVQTDIHLAEHAGQDSCRDEAITVLYEVIEQGWSTYDTYNTLVILCQKQSRLTEAEQILNQMIQMFKEDYNMNKRFAFLEIEKQEQLENQARDYSKFASYFEKAKQMYEEQLKNNDTDAEMELLENVYEQVKAGGWL